MFRSIVEGMGRLLAVFYDLIPNYGVSIILLTLTVRVAMIPLAVKQAHMMVAQREKMAQVRKLQPEIKRIKEKYKGDRTRAYEEQKKLMDEHGVNTASMLGGCLPTVLQIPIFMAMYQVLSGCDKLLFAKNCLPGTFIPRSSALHAAILGGGATFLGMSLKDRPSAVLKADGLAEAWPYYLFCLLMGATMYYQTKLMSKGQPNPDPQMAQTQKIMQRFFPAMVTFASINFPIGLTLYWTTTNVWTIGQQALLLKRFGPDADAAPKPRQPKSYRLPGKPAPEAPSSADGTPQARATDNGRPPQPPSRAKPKGSGARKGKKKKSRR